MPAAGLVRPVNRWFQLALFLIGVALFGHLVADIGVDRLWADAVASGWMMVPIVLLFGVVYICDTQALRLILEDELNPPGFAAAFATVVSGNSLNFITPMINVGGEPYKIATLAPRLGAHRAAGAVIVHSMLRILAQLLAWVTAVLLGFMLLPHQPRTVGLLLLALIGLGALVTMLLALHRRGGIARIAAWLSGVRVLKGLAVTLERERPALEAMDAQIADFYHRRPRRFLAALGLEYLSRAVFMAEFILIGMSVGVRVGYLDAFAIGGLEGLIGNVLFFVPFGLGTRESAMVLMFRQLGYSGRIGLYAALVGRIRDLIWIAVGLGLIWVRGRRLRSFQVDTIPGIGHYLQEEHPAAIVRSVERLEAAISESARADRH